MRRNLLKSLTVFMLSVLAAAVIVGCGESQNRGIKPSGPKKDGYKGGGLVCEAIASFYNGSDWPYITRHLIHFDPGGKNLTITGDEPGGVIMWSISAGGFSVRDSGDNKVKGGIEREYYTVEIGRSVLYSMLASVGAAGGDEPNGDAVRIEGIWYEPVVSSVKGGEVTYYRNTDSGRIELVSFLSENGTEIRSRIYNYRYYANVNNVMAGNIELSRYVAQNKNNKKEEIILQLEFKTYMER